MTVLILHVNRSKQNCQTQQERAIFSSWNNLGSVDHLSGTMHTSCTMYNDMVHTVQCTLVIVLCTMKHSTLYSLH